MSNRTDDDGKPHDPMTNESAGGIDRQHPASELISGAIDRYRAELLAEADLARGDLDEIEDHLRSLTADLRAAGMPAASAVTEAARRLGDPRELAREHARVSSPFGARISRARAWSAAILLLPFAIWYGVEAVRGDRLVSPFGLETLLATGLLVAIALRLSWARAFVLGTLPTSIAGMLAWSVTWGGSRLMLAQLVCYAGVLAFLVPWRRGELSRAGFGLALMGPAYGGAATLLGFHVTNPGGDPVGVALGFVAIGGVLLGALGGMMRARWGAFPALAGSIALALATLVTYPLEVRYSHPDMVRVIMLGSLALGSLAAAASAVLCWRHARSTTGTLRGLLA